MSKLPDYNDSTMKLFIKIFIFKGNIIGATLAVKLKRDYAANTLILKKQTRKHSDLKEPNYRYVESETLNIANTSIKS